MISDHPAGGAPEASGSSLLRRSLPLLLLLSLTPAFYVASRVVVESIHLLGAPYETSRPEAFILDGVSRVAAGRHLYGDLETLPFVVHVYNPAIYVTVGTAARILHSDLPGMLRLGRIFSYSCAVLLAAVLGLIVKRETGSRLGAALIPVALLIFHPPLLSGFYRLRAEMPATLATFAGVAVVLSSRRHRMDFAAVLFFVAFTFKQPFISAPIATFLFLLASGSRRDAFRLAGGLGVLLLLFFALMAVWSGGHYYESAILSMAWNDVEPLNALRANFPPLWTRIGGLLVALPPAVLVLTRSGRLRLLVWYLGVSAAVTFYTAGKFGSQLNYYTELGVLLLLVAFLAAGLSKGLLRWCIVAPIVAHVWVDALDTRSLERRFEGVESVDLDAAVEHFRGLEGRLLVTNERLAVRLGDPEVLDWVLMKHLADRGHFDTSQLFDRIRQGYYDHVIVDPQITSPLEAEVFEAVRSGPYERSFRGETWNAMRSFRRVGAAGPPGTGPPR